MPCSNRMKPAKNEQMFRGRMVYGLAYNGASSVEECAAYAKRSPKQTLALLRRMLMDQIVEYDPVNDLWNLFCPADWFGDDLKTDQRLSRYKSADYKYINRMFNEQDDWTAAKFRLNARRIAK